MFREDGANVEIEEEPRHPIVAKKYFKNRLIQALEGLK